MVSALQLPGELWLQIFGFLSWRDKLRVRTTCCTFKELLDKSRLLWRGFSVVLRDFQRYNRPFWRSLAQRRVSSVCLRHSRRTHLKQLSSCLPAIEALRLDDLKEEGVDDLRLFRRLKHLSVTSCFTAMKSVDFLSPLRDRLTHLSLCNVALTCTAAQLTAAIAQLTRLTALQLHHGGALRIPAFDEVLAALPELAHLSATMVTYKTLPENFFSPAPFTGGALKLSDLQLLNYDAVVTPDVLLPLSNLRSLSVFHLYSVPGPTCHLTTWLSSLTELRSLSVHGGHPLSAYADFLPSSLVSLMLCVDLQPDDLYMVSLRAPQLEHLHLEPWGSSSNLVKLLPQLFPHLKTLKIRHHHVSDADFLSLQHLQRLHTLEILDAFHRPDPSDPSWVVSGPSPRLLQLTSHLQQQTNRRVHVITSSRRDALSCDCV